MMKEYTVTINGHETTLQLDDDDAVRWGVKEPVRQLKGPIGTGQTGPKRS